MFSSLRRILTGALLLLQPFCSQSQNLSIHVDGGAVNYGGDLQSQLFTLQQANSFFGGGLHYRLSGHFSLEGTFAAGKLAATDAKTKVESVRRNLSFYTNITEGSLVLHANLKDVPGSARLTPYILAGVAFFHYNPYTYYQGQKVYLQPLGTEGQGLSQFPDRKLYSLTQFAIPFGGGLKYAVNDRIMIGGEIAFRKLFTDYLDDVSSKRYVDTGLLRATRGPLSAKMSFRSDETSNPLNFNGTIQRGNPERKDVYYTILLKLYISLGGNNDGNNAESKRLRRQSSCPPKI